jgi:hypothetical protein
MRISLTTPMTDDKERQRRNEVILAAIEQYTEERMSDDHTASSQPTQIDALLEGDAQTILYLLGVRHGREDERAKIAAETRQPTQSDALRKELATRFYRKSGEFQVGLTVPEATILAAEAFAFLQEQSK